MIVAPFLILVTVIKLVVAATVGGSSDIPQQLLQAEAYLAARDLMNPVSTGNNPSFFPIGHYGLTAVALLIAQATGTAFAFWIKTPAIAADLGIALLLRTIPQAGPRVALAYMLSPVSLLLSVYHGQVHTVATGAAVLAVWLGGRGRPVPGALALAIAASIRQHFAVLLLPVAMRAGRQRGVTILVFGAAMAIMNASLLGSASPGRVLTPTWIPSTWGYAVPFLQGPRLLARLGFDVSSFFGPLNRALLTYGAALYWLWAVAFSVWLWRRSGGVDLWRASLFFILGFYAVSPGSGVQWLVWALPFWLAVDYKQGSTYSALAGTLLAGSYWVWTFNAKYGVGSVSANLQVLDAFDLTVYLLVGALGLLLWAFCARSAWRLARSTSSERRRWTGRPPWGLRRPGLHHPGSADRPPAGSR